jgi:hypothetical protein
MNSTDELRNIIDKLHKMGITKPRVKVIDFDPDEGGIQFLDFKYTMYTIAGSPENREAWIRRLKEEFDEVLIWQWEIELPA